jgi:hypothetical protein
MVGSAPLKRSGWAESMRASSSGSGLGSAAVRLRIMKWATWAWWPRCQPIALEFSFGGQVTVRAEVVPQLIGVGAARAPATAASSRSSRPRLHVLGHQLGDHVKVVFAWRTDGVLPAACRRSMIRLAVLCVVPHKLAART